MNELKTVVMSAAEGVLGRRSRDIGELKGRDQIGREQLPVQNDQAQPDGHSRHHKAVKSQAKSRAFRGTLCFFKSGGMACVCAPA